MASARVLDVRGVLQRHSYSTTLEELQNRGKRRVRVVRASEIATLLEEAVARALGDRRDSPGFETTVAGAESEFRGLLEGRGAGGAEGSPRFADLEEALRRVRELESECQRLRGEVIASRALPGAIGMEGTVRTQSPAAGTDPGAFAEAIERFAGELEALRGQIGSGGGRAGGGPGSEGAIASKFDSFASAVHDRLERIARKVGAPTTVEVEPAGLERIFEGGPTLESNLENLEVKERRAGDIARALERIRSLRRREGGE